MTIAVERSQTRPRRAFWTMARRDAAAGYLFIAVVVSAPWPVMVSVLVITGRPVAPKVPLSTTVRV